ERPERPEIAGLISTPRTKNWATVSYLRAQNIYRSIDKNIFLFTKQALCRKGIDWHYSFLSKRTIL
ncbi:hypothetical protein, partial [Pectobacterium carotovorum]|uniref:hypothetical protein n=1 Tax=Pectobacterium carotovorum TaxID=554 RepID=UPI001BE0AAD7